MAKKRTHYLRIKVVFDKPVGQWAATAAARNHLAGEDHFLTISEEEETGAGAFKVSGVAAAT